MLYDTRWDKPVYSKPQKTAAVSLEGLIAWLEGQDLSTRYSYGNIDDCLLSRYFKARGFRWAFCGPTCVHYSRFFLPPLFTKTIPLEMNDVAIGSPGTYGAALERARAAL